MEQAEGRMSSLTGFNGYPGVTILDRIAVILFLLHTTQVIGQNVIPEFKAYGDGQKSEGEW